MGIFAAPEFGVSGIIVVIVLIVWAVIVLLAVGGVLFGAQLLWHKSSRAKRVAGGLLLVVSCLLPVVCYFAPPYIVRLEYGNYPIGSYARSRIREGMSGNEVLMLLGPPQKRFREAADRETWIYWMDSYGAHWFGVDFGPDEHVTDTFGN